MRYKTLTYQRVVNLGSYESERLQVEVELEDGDDEHYAAEQIQQYVHSALKLKAGFHLVKDAENEAAEKEINF